jgi:hypothetical protein
MDIRFCGFHLPLRSSYHERGTSASEIVNVYAASRAPIRISRPIYAGQRDVDSEEAFEAKLKSARMEPAEN